MAPSCLELALGVARAFLYPRLGYVPKVPSLVPRSVMLQAFCPSPFWDPDQEKLNCMCPVRGHWTRMSTELPFGGSLISYLSTMVLLRKVFL